MAIDRKKFFEGVRQGPFPGKLQASQVSGMNAILDEWERRNLTELPMLADMLATAYHETFASMQPVIETRNPSKDKTNPSVDTAIARLESSWKRGKMPWVKSAYWRKDKDGLSWLGRGLPQVTHKFNYAKAEKALGIPFTKKPELMLEMKHAIPVMFEGMLNGWFTGKKLSDYFGPGMTPQWRNARKIINGLEKADVVAGYAKQFYTDLVNATA